MRKTARGWTEQWFAEGVEQGRAEGIAAQREVLRRQATLRFAASARLLDAHLEGVGSSAKLAEISEWLMVDTVDQLIAKINTATADDRID